MILGIDTGGVCSDFVLFDENKGGIVGRSKLQHGPEGVGGVFKAGLSLFPKEALGELDQVVFVTTKGLDSEKIVCELLSCLKTIGSSCPVFTINEAGEHVALTVDLPQAGVGSGMAASLLGAYGLTGEAEAYVLDIGGVFTKVGRICQGKLAQNREDAPIAPASLAGDSPISLSPMGEIAFDSGRGMPLAMAGKTAPGFFSEMTEERSAFTPWLKKGYPFGLVALQEGDHPLFTLLAKGPRTIPGLARETALPDPAALADWNQSGFLLPVVLTPTDLFHVNGGYVEGERAVSYLGAELLGEICDLAPFAFTQYALGRLGEELHHFLTAHCPGFFDGEERIPLIAVGGPAATWLRFLSLGGAGKIILPPCGEMAGAVGAAIG